MRFSPTYTSGLSIKSPKLTAQLFQNNTIHTKNSLPQGEFLVALSGLILEVENEIDPNKSFQDKSIWRWQEEYTLTSWNQQLNLDKQHHPKKDTVFQTQTIKWFITVSIALLHQMNGCSLKLEVFSLPIPTK